MKDKIDAALPFSAVEPDRCFEFGCDPYSGNAFGKMSFKPGEEEGIGELEQTAVAH